MAEATKLAALRVSADMDASGFAKGAAEIEASTKRAGAAAKSLSDTIAETNTRLRPASDGLEKLKRQFIDGYAATANFERGLNDINRGLERGALTAEQAERALVGLNRRYGMTADSAILAAKGQTQLAAAADKANAVIARQPPALRAMNDNLEGFRKQNLSYQLFDIGQSASLGMPIDMVAAQQLPQVIQLYAGQGGLKAALADVGAIAAGVIGTVGALPLALGTAGAAALAYFSLTSEKMRSTDELLAAHGQNIRALATAYGIAEQAATSYSTASQAIASAQTKGTLEEAVAKQIEEAKALQQQFSNVITPGKSGGSYLQLKPDFAPFKSAFDELGRDIRAGTVDANEFVEQIKKIADGNPAVSSFADEVLRAAAEVFKLNAEIERTKTMLDSIGANRQGPMINDPEFLEWLRTRPGTKGAVNPFDPKEHDPFADLHNPAGSRRDIAGQVQAAQSLFQTQAQQLDQLRLEAQLVGESAETRARLTAGLQAEQQLRQAGIDLLSREGQAYKANAEAMADARLQIERSQQAYQSWQQAGSSAIDALTASTGSLGDRLKNMADSMLSWVTQMALANPIKNSIYGEAFSLELETAA